MKYILILIVLLSLFSGCCSFKNLNCQECKIFNKRLKSEMIYDATTQSAYINIDKLYENDWAVKDILVHAYCWQGMGITEFKKMFPFLFEQEEEGLQVYANKKYFDCSHDSDPLSCNRLSSHGAINAAPFFIKIKTEDKIEKIHVHFADYGWSDTLIIE